MNPQFIDPRPAIVADVRFRRALLYAIDRQEISDTLAGGVSPAIERYAEKSGRDLTNLDFYVVLAYFKLAVIVEGIYARFLEGGTVGTGFEATGAQAKNLARAGLAVAERSSIAALRG